MDHPLHEHKQTHLSHCEQILPYQTLIITCSHDRQHVTATISVSALVQPPGFLVPSFYRQQPIYIPLYLEPHFCCSSGLFQSQWRLRTFARNAVYEETCSFSRSSDPRSITITSERAYVSMLIVVLIVTFVVVQANNLPFPATRSKVARPKAYVKIVAGELHRRTQSVKWQKDTFTRWDSKLDL